MNGDNPVQLAQRTWRESLNRLADGPGWVASIEAEQRSRDLLYGEEPAMRVAEPLFVTAAEMAADRAAIAAVLAGLKAAGDAVIGDEALRATYASSWWESMPHPDLLSADVGYSQPFVFGRLDALRTSAGLRFLEFNGGLPGGVLPTDIAASILAQTSIAAELSASQAFSIAEPGEKVISALVTTWHQFGGSGQPFVVVALPHELVALAARAVEHLRHIAEGRGIEMVVADPGELTFAGQRLRLNGRPVDVVVRAFFTPMFAYLGERLEGLLAAIRAEAVCMVTSLQSGLYGLKSLFAVVTDLRVPLDLPEDQRELANQALPWTRLLTGGLTIDADGREVELRDYVLARRSELVIKPMEGYGGTGVELGWLHTADSWQAVVDQAMGGGHIVQQRVETAEQEFARLEPGFPLGSFIADQNPLICDGELAGYFARLAPGGGGLTNLSAGDASVTGVFILD